jgi:glutamine amidotransferase
MCRLLGIKNFNFKKHAAALNEFLDLAESGKVPPNNSPGHADGWGVGYYRSGGAVTAKNGTSASGEMANVVGMLQEVDNTEALIVHLRKSAWPLTSTKRQAHPFEFKNRLFAHNGTILDFQKLLSETPSAFRAETDALDTEVFFRYMMQFEDLEMPEAFKKAIEYAKENTNYTSLTSLITDGKTICACREYANFHPDYYTLFHSSNGDSNVICSEKLPSIESWTEFNNE